MNWAPDDQKKFIDKLTEVTLDNIENEHFGGRHLAIATGLSLSTLNRRLQSITGQSSNHFIRGVRMNKARELLLDGGHTVAEVGFMVGFTSPAYFTKCFHDHFGHVPGEASLYSAEDNAKNQAYGTPADKGGFGAAFTRSVLSFRRLRPVFRSSPFLLSLLGLAILILLLILLTTGYFRIARPLGSNEVKTVAVLPFKNLSPDPENQYLADGIMEDIINNLYNISDLRILSRTTTESFRESGYSIPEISKMTRADYLVEGSVRREGQRLRITVQLIDGKSDHHLWSENYDRSMADIFDIQSDIALNVARSLRALLSSNGAERLEVHSTSNLNAYDFYLRGRDYEYRSYESRDFFLAKQMYERAVAIDPGYALAWAGLAAVRRQLHWFYDDRSEENLLQAKEALDNALALLPGSKIVQFEKAMYHYHCRRNYPEALRLLEALTEKFPEDDELVFMIGMVKRRMGEFQQSIEYCNKAISLNPFHWKYWFEIALNHHIIRDYSKAEQYLLKSLEINPSNFNTYSVLFNHYLLNGQIRKAHEFLFTHEYYFNPLEFKLFKGKLEYFARDFRQAIQTIGSIADDRQLLDRQSNCYSKHLQLALCYRSIPGDTMSAYHFRVERDLMFEMIRENENDDRLYRTLGIACAGLGQKEEALQAATKAFEIRRPSIDRFQGCLTEVDLVKILVLLGENEEALVRLEPLIKDCGFISTFILQHDPFWDPLRDYELFGRIVSDPSFQASF